MNVRTTLVSSFAVLLFACGGSVADPAEPGTDGGTDTSPSDGSLTDTTPGPDVGPDTTPTDGGPGPDSGPTKGCPASPPSMGAPCAPIGLVCGYGDDPRPSCRQQATCKATGWDTPVGACPPPPTEVCPPTEGDANGKACTTAGAFCTYGDVVCGCGNCFGGPCGGASKWVCPDPPADADCPRKMPNLGVACAKEGLKCTYGSCSSNNIAGRTCTGGVFVDEPQACPL